jgi:hypothetical protein
VTPPALSIRRKGAAREPADAVGVRQGSLWFGLFGAPFFWSLQLIITYALAAHACYPRHAALLTFTSPAVRAAACSVIVAALGGCAAATTISIRNCLALRAVRRAPTGDGDGDGDGGAREGRTRFMAYSGVLLGTLFTGAVVLSAVAVLLLPLCW